MKKIIPLIAFFTIAVAAFSQQTNPPPTLPKQDYLLISKHQKTAAWLLVGGGVVLSATSLILIAQKGAEDVFNIIPGVITGDPKPQHDYTAETILLTVGGAAMLSSIPLFIASGRNKGKSLSLSLKNETTRQLQKNSFVYKTIPSITFKISL